MDQFKRNIPFGFRFKYGTMQWFDHFFGRKTFFKNREKFYAKLEKILEKQGPGQLRPIERRTDLTKKEFMNHYVAKGIPVVMEGAAKDWDCVKTWSPQYFKELHGEDDIVIVDQNDADYPYELLKLKDVIDSMGSAKQKYYRFYPLLSRHPEHLKDFDHKWLKERRTRPIWFNSFQVFMGGKGTYTPLHNANQGNLFVQVYGEKNWVLYSHYYTPIIDPLPARNLYRNAPAKVDHVFNPFEDEFEPPFKLYKYMDGLTVNLKPGDVFWNPPFYWHTVKNPTDSIGVGYRWLSPFNAYRRSPLYFSLDMMSFRPPIWKSIGLYKKDLNTLFLEEVRKLADAKKKVAEQEAKKATKKEEISKII